VYNTPLKVYICPADSTVVNQNSGNQNSTNTGSTPFYFQWAASSYSANYQVFGTVNNFGSPTSGNSAGPAFNIGNLPDGNSNTVFFGEQFAACTNTAGTLWAYPGIGNYSGTQYSSSVYPAVQTNNTLPDYGGYQPVGASGLVDTPTQTVSYLWAPAFCNNASTAASAYGFTGQIFGGTATAPFAALGFFDNTPQTGITQAQCDKSRLQGFHTAAVVVGMGDGSARLVNSNLTQATWYAACLPADGNPLGSDW
jgi:hypothetical protein